MSSLVLLTLMLLSGGSPSPDPAGLVVSPAQAARAQFLVQQLGSDSYRDRDRATRELEQMGRLALAALDSARESPDPEVRLRAGILYPRAEADELKARINTFLSDQAGKYAHDLPGWNSFARMAGNDKQSRDLFAAILRNKANHELLQALRITPSMQTERVGGLAGGIALVVAERPPEKALSQAILARRQAMQMGLNMVNPGIAVGGVYRPPMPELPDIALLLLAESLISERAIPQGGVQYHLANYFFQPNGREAMSGSGPFGQAVRRLTLNWMESRDGPLGAANALTIAQIQNLPPEEVARFAARILNLPGAQAWNKAHAASMIARHNAQKYLPDLVRQFKDTTVLVRGGPNNGVNDDLYVKDVALAMALLLTGQKPADYGLTAQQTQDAARYGYTNYRFIKDAVSEPEVKRMTAFAKWTAWQETRSAGVAGPAGVIAPYMAEQKTEKKADQQKVNPAP